MAAPKSTSISLLKKKNTKTAHTKKAKGKSKTVKTLLSFPYTIKWPPISEDCIKIITTKLTETFTTLNLAKPRRPAIKQFKEQKGAKERYAMRKKMVKEQMEARSPREKNIRSQLILGINNLTRLLEKKQLRLLLVSDDATVNASLTGHMISLSVIAQCPAAAVTSLRDVVSSALNMRCVSAIGFKKTNENDECVFDELVTSISQQIPPITASYVNVPLATPTSDPIRGGKDNSDAGVAQLDTHIAEGMDIETTPTQHTKNDSNLNKNVSEAMKASENDIEYSHLLIHVDKCQCEIHKTPAADVLIVEPSIKIIDLTQSDKAVMEKKNRKRSLEIKAMEKSRVRSERIAKQARLSVATSVANKFNQVSSAPISGFSLENFSAYLSNVVNNPVGLSVEPPSSTL